jgi:poly(A) polymerase
MKQENLKKYLTHPVFEHLRTTVNQTALPTYVVGGFVRDRLLGKPFKADIDIVCVGSGIAFAESLHPLLKGAKPITVFKTYGTAMIQWQDLTLEFVGARKESYQKHSRNPIVQIGTLEEDQNRRDFTVNALAISLNENDYGALIDPFHGMDDLHAKILRTPNDPNITYSDDPLRMLRAIRFACQLDFTIALPSLEAIRENAQRITIISRERIVEELHKIIACDQPSAGFLLLEKTGLLPYILPELCALKGIEEIEGHRHKDNFYHTLEVVDNICAHTDNLWLRWAALLHDIGKAPTKKLIPPTGWTFHGHEFVGAKMVYKLFKRLRMPLNEKMKYVQKLVLLSARPIALVDDQVTDAAIRRLIFDAGDLLDDLFTLCQADITTKNPNRFKRYHENFQWVRQKMEAVEVRDAIRNFQPPISGEMIMKYYNIGPSRPVGLIKEAIKEAILEGEIPNEKEAAWIKMIEEGKKLGLKSHEK